MSKQRKLVENINDRNELSANIDFRQIQKAESNHVSNFSSNQTLFEKIKARIVKLMQQILSNFIKAQIQI